MENVEKVQRLRDAAHVIKYIADNAFGMELSAISDETIKEIEKAVEILKLESDF